MSYTVNKCKDCGRKTKGFGERCGSCAKKGVLHPSHFPSKKENCNPENLITTCNWCNVRTNKNRKYWKDFYFKKTENKILKKEFN